MFSYDFVIFADTMSYYVVCKTDVSGHQHTLECDVCRQWTTFFCAGSDGYTFLKLYWYEGESSRDRYVLLQGAQVPGSESSM